MTLLKNSSTAEIAENAKEFVRDFLVPLMLFGSMQIGGGNLAFVALFIRKMRETEVQSRSLSRNSALSLLFVVLLTFFSGIIIKLILQISQVFSGAGV